MIFWPSNALISKIVRSDNVFMFIFVEDLLKGLVIKWDDSRIFGSLTSNMGAKCLLLIYNSWLSL